MPEIHLGSDRPARAPWPAWRLPVLWEVPTAFLSFLLFKLVRLAYLIVGYARWLMNPGTLHPWRILDRERIAGRGKLIEQLVLGPRWNTAASVGACGPFAVTRQISLDMAPLRALRFWSLILYAPPVTRIKHVNSTMAAARADALPVALPPGRYWLTLRLYPAPGATTPTLPAVTVDDRVMAPPRPFIEAVDSLFRSLISRTNPFLVALQAHSQLFAKWECLLGADFVRRTLLPVGDPETRFFYGILRSGEAPTFICDPEIFRTTAIFFTSYSLSSLPYQWYEITSETFTGPAVDRQCLYVVRVVAVNETAFTSTHSMGHVK